MSVILQALRMIDRTHEGKAGEAAQDEGGFIAQGFVGAAENISRGR